MNHKPTSFLHNLAFCIIVLSLFTGCSQETFSIKTAAIKNTSGECVILLHGMGRTYHSMNAMQEAVTEAGFHTVNLDYPSRKMNIETIAKEYVPQALNQCEQFNPAAIHFVTHSLGGIVVRKAIKENRPARLGRVVMLSPPNRGSELADTLKTWRLYGWLNGLAGQQLSTAPDSLPNQLGPVNYPVGVITGDRHAFFDGWFSRRIPGRNDGKVSVQRAKVEGMSDFLVVAQSHPFIMDSDYVQAETIHFLRHGIFRRWKPPLPPVSGADWFTIQ